MSTVHNTIKDRIGKNHRGTEVPQHPLTIRLDCLRPSPVVDVIVQKAVTRELLVVPQTGLCGSPLPRES